VKAAQRIRVTARLGIAAHLLYLCTSVYRIWAVHAVLARALEEGYSLALEGVHIVPGMVRPPGGALVCQVLLAIEDEADHEGHFWTRDSASDGMRPFEKYLRALPDIRRIQDYLVKEAAKAGVPVIENSRVEETVDRVIDLVLDQIERELETA